MSFAATERISSLTRGNISDLQKIRIRREDGVIVGLFGSLETEPTGGLQRIRVRRQNGDVLEVIGTLWDKTSFWQRSGTNKKQFLSAVQEQSTEEISDVDDVTLSHDAPVRPKPSKTDASRPRYLAPDAHATIKAAMSKEKPLDMDALEKKYAGVHGQTHLSESWRRQSAPVQAQTSLLHDHPDRLRSYTITASAEPKEYMPPTNPATHTEPEPYYMHGEASLALRRPPSGVRPDYTKKKYCNYWIKNGLCDYMQQGCKFKHEMPDMVGRVALGLSPEMPEWYRQRHAVQEDSERFGRNVPEATVQQHKQAKTGTWRHGNGHQAYQSDSVANTNQQTVSPARQQTSHVRVHTNRKFTTRLRDLSEPAQQTVMHARSSPGRGSSTVNTTRTFTRRNAVVPERSNSEHSSDSQLSAEQSGSSSDQSLIDFDDIPIMSHKPMTPSPAGSQTDNPPSPPIMAPSACIPEHELARISKASKPSASVVHPRIHFPPAESRDVERSKHTSEPSSDQKHRNADTTPPASEESSTISVQRLVRKPIQQRARGKGAAKANTLNAGRKESNERTVVESGKNKTGLVAAKHQNRRRGSRKGDVRRDSATPVQVIVA